MVKTLKKLVMDNVDKMFLVDINIPADNGNKSPLMIRF